MHPIDIIVFVIAISLPFTAMMYLNKLRYEDKYIEMITTAAFRYQTDCYMNGTYPCFEIVDFIKPLPPFRTTWKSMVPRAYHEILEPYMEELKNDPRFS